MASKPHNPGQLGLFRPESSWKPPTELPDLRGRPIVAIDSETRDEGLANNRGPGWALGPAGYICGVSWATEGSVGYAPIRHPDTECFPLDNVMRWLDDLFKSGTRIVMHNGPYDLGWFGCYGVEPPVNLEDTLAGAVMLDESQAIYKKGETPYSLDNCCARYGIPGKDTALLIEAVRAYGGNAAKPKGDLWRVPARYAAPYAEQDGVATLDLWRVQEPQLRAQDVWDAYRLELDLIPLVVAMRRRGIRIDVDKAKRTGDMFRARGKAGLEELSNRVQVGRRLTVDDVRSPAMLERLFNAENISFPRTEKTKQGSFSADWMRVHPHWLPQLVSQIKRDEEAATKFIDNYLLGFVHRGRIHAEVHQFKSDEGGTKSHRFSYSEPPLQQMPTPDKDPTDDLKQIIEDRAYGVHIRRCFLPERNTRWLASDYCHDDKTDILTEKGWVNFAELPRGLRVAQYKAGALEFVLPTDYYVGAERERVLVTARGQKAVDFAVTPEHEMLFIQNGVETRCKASTLPARIDTSMLPTSGTLVGGLDAESEDILRLVVALQADAAYRKTNWRFRLKKERKLSRLIALLERLGVKYSVSNRVGKSGKTDITVWPPLQIMRYLGSDKVFNRRALFELSLHLRDVFLAELAHWDGSHNSMGVSYPTTIVENAETVHALAILTGYEATVKVRARNKDATLDSVRKDIATVRIIHKSRTRNQRAYIERLSYFGRVYCVTVPSNAIVTRRSGRVLISGNSQQEPRLTVHFAALCKARGADTAVAQYLDNPRTDFHTLVAQMTGKPRSQAKILNLAMMYNLGLASLADKLGVSLDEARLIFNEYHERLPFVKALDDTCKSAADRRGYIRLIDGARMRYEEWDGPYLPSEVRYAAIQAGHNLSPCSLQVARERQEDPDHPWHGKRLRRFGTRTGLNNLVQGSAARQTKRAMLECWRQGILPLIQMHDEIGAPAESEAKVNQIREIMVNAVPLKVPVIVDAEVGPTWGDAKLSWSDCEAKYGPLQQLAA